MVGSKNILDKPYSDRRLILFVEDEVVQAHIRAEEAVLESRKFNAGIELYLEYFKERLKHWYIDDLCRIMALARSYFLAKRDGVDIKLVEKSLVGSFHLPPGHPRDAIVYAGHPAMAKYYIPVHEFHRVVFEHKFSEVISILMNLGAKNIHVRHLKGWGLDFLLNMAPIPVWTPVTPPQKPIEETKARSLLDIYKKNVSVPAEVCEKLTPSIEQVVLLRTTAKTNVQPRLPSYMAWYPFEATWQWVGEGRLKFGLKEFVVELGYREDYDINSSVKSKLEKAGFHSNGEFENHVQTMWRVFGEFWDAD